MLEHEDVPFLPPWHFLVKSGLKKKWSDPEVASKPSGGRQRLLATGSAGSLFLNPHFGVRPLVHPSNGV